MTDHTFKDEPERSWEDYWSKWDSSFQTGIENFITDWFMSKKNALY